MAGGIRSGGLAAFLLASLVVAPHERALAQQGLTLTVTPPLIQVALEPGQSWGSGIDVVNNNPYPMTVYAEVVRFEPDGESGKPHFLLNEERFDGPTSLDGWISIAQEAYEVAPEATVRVPFTIVVPSDASPGGHYAAILLGNRPPQGVSTDESVLSVTSSIASLLFLTVAGEVVEDGRVRDFVTERSMYKKPEARFSLRFENVGNVHLQPKGDITIYNMFGKVRGVVPVNTGSENFGNVLPGSVRKFAFMWESDTGMWDIGRYRADVTLAYGKDVKRHALASTYFYVLPIAPLLEIVAGVLAVFFFFGWTLRAYVRRALLIETAQHGELRSDQEQTGQARGQEAEPEIELRTLLQPLKVGMVDLRSVVTQRPTQEPATRTHPWTPLGFLNHYRYFFLFVFVCALVWFVASLVFTDVLTYERPFEYEALEIE